MQRLYQMAEGTSKRFPEGNEPFQMVARLLEECGEVASEVNNWENSGIKRQKYGEPDKKKLANEIRQSMVALTQIVIYYAVQKELDTSIDESISRMISEGLLHAG